MQSAPSSSTVASVDAGPPEPAQKSPFTIDDFFCTAPLAVFDNALYAGGQRGGSLYRFRDGE